MATLVEDAQRYAEWIAKALTSSGYPADFSLESLREIDRFFDEHSSGGEPISDGFLSEQLGKRIFALGAYTGEVLCRAYGGRWQADDNDPEGEMNLAVVFPNGSTVWPVRRVMKRFKNGPEDCVYGYGRAMRDYSGPEPPPWTKGSY